MAIMELADRCERATGPDCILDAEIDLALNMTPHEAESPEFTSSIDAAMSLVPEGLEGRVEWRTGKGMHPAYGSIWTVGARDVDFHANGHGKTPALALCAAALKARAMKENGDHGE